MIITINSILLDEWNLKEIIQVKNIKLTNRINEINKPDTFINVMMASAAVATGDFSGLEKVIVLFQQFAYYIGMGYAIWGSIEYSMDNPSGSDKMKRAVIGFIGVYVIPVIFRAIRSALG